MERIVRILNQSQLATRQYLDKKTGEQKTVLSTIHSTSTGCNALW